MRHLFYVSQLYSLAILRPVQEAAWRRGDECAWFFDPPLAGGQYLRPDETLLGTVADVINWRPDAVYVPGNTVPDFFPGIKVQVFHGLATDETGKKGHYRIRGFFDLYCTRNSYETAQFEALASRYGHFKVVETGWPKLDPLYSHPDVDLKGRLDIDKPVVLYASTFSPSLTSAPVLRDKIAELARSGDWFWLVTLHPKMDASIVQQYRQLGGDNLRFFECDADLLPLLQAADVMLCDTSSIAIEFQALQKPLVTFRNKSPGPQMINVTAIDQVEAALAEALTRPEPLMTETARFMQAIHPYQDGASSQRLLEAVDRFHAGDFGALKAKPLNLLRKLKVRRKLGYYAFNRAR